MKRRRSWWSYINDKDKPKRGFGAASRFRKLNPLSSSERTIEAARSEIVTVCQLGCWIGEGDQADTLASLRRRLEAAGLETLGRLLAPLQPGYAAPEAVLAAMYALSLARESAASLPYLQRMS